MNNQCPDCSATFSRPSSLKRHQETHADRRYVCAECSKSFYRKDFLRRHMKIHTGEGQQYCPHCGSGFGRKYLEKHNKACRFRLGPANSTTPSDGSQAASAKATRPIELIWNSTEDQQPLRLVQPNSRTIRQVVNDARSAVVSDDLPRLKGIIASLPDPWSTPLNFIKMYDEERVKWTPSWQRGEAYIRKLRESCKTYPELRCEWITTRGPSSITKQAIVVGALDILQFLTAEPEVLLLPQAQDLLHFAMYHDRHDIIKHLVEADRTCLDRRTVSWPDIFDEPSPLQIAVETGKIETVRLLIEFGCDIDAQCNRYQRPIISVALSEYQYEIAELLITSGADVRAKDGDGWTPLHHAACHGETSVMRSLVSHGAEIDAVDDYGDTPLTVASEYGKIEAMELLLDHGANMNGPPSTEADTQSRLPLLSACEGAAEFDYGLGAVQLLISRGADVDKLYLPEGAEKNSTALSYVCALPIGYPRYALGIVKIFIGAGADVNTGEPSPLEGSLRNADSAEVSEFLLDVGADASNVSTECIDQLQGAASQQELHDDPQRGLNGREWYVRDTYLDAKAKLRLLEQHRLKHLGERWLEVDDFI